MPRCKNYKDTYTSFCDLRLSFLALDVDVPIKTNEIWHSGMELSKGLHNIEKIKVCTFKKRNLEWRMLPRPLNVITYLLPSYSKIQFYYCWCQFLFYLMSRKMVKRIPISLATFWFKMTHCRGVMTSSRSQKCVQNCVPSTCSDPAYSQSTCFCL